VSIRLLLVPLLHDGYFDQASLASANLLEDHSLLGNAVYDQPLEGVAGGQSDAIHHYGAQLWVVGIDVGRIGEAVVEQSLGFRQVP